MRNSTVIGFLVLTVLASAVVERSHGQLRESATGTVGGFGRLPWGATVAQARSIYPDLRFERYVVENGGREPVGIHYRQDASEEIRGIVFDFIEYRFREARFCGIRAVMRSRIGPRSLVTRSEESFARLRRILGREYGAPTTYGESYFTDFVTVTRTARWDRPDAVVVLTYRGPETTNEDQLSFELREGGRH